MLAIVAPVLFFAAAWPANLTIAAAGMSAEARTVSVGCWHDPASGYYLYKSMNCDGAHERHLDQRSQDGDRTGFEVARFGRKPDEAAGASIEERKLELVTKNGIHIGMSREEVVGKLGEPTRTEVRGAKKQYWCALYKRWRCRTASAGACCATPTSSRMES